MREKGVPNRETPFRNLELIKENAIIVFHVSEEGEVSVIENDRPRLDVLAVIGPYKGEKWDLKEAVLMEVGFGYTRPYNEVHIPKELRHLNEPQNFPPRYRGFSMTTRQYQAVAPFIFEYLEQRAVSQVSMRKGGWKNYKIKALGHMNSGEKISKAVLGRKGQLIAVDLKYEKLPMVRYGASMSDILLINDLYWAEIYGNSVMKGQFEAMASEMRGLLNKATKKLKKTPKSWLKSPEFVAALNKLDRFTIAWGDEFRDRKYLQRILLRDYLDQRHYFFDELAERIKWSGDPIIEDIMAKNALSDPKSRLNDIQIKVWRKKGDLLSFDVYPKRPNEDQEVIPF